MVSHFPLSCRVEKLRRACEIRVYGFVRSAAEWLLSGHEDRSESGVECLPSCSDRLAALQVCDDVLLGVAARCLFRDNDGIYGHGVQAFLEHSGIQEVCTRYRCAGQNSFIERLIGTLRRELLDHVIVLRQSHLDRLLREYIADYYHIARPHQGLDHDTPVSHGKPGPVAGPPTLNSIGVVGGLHHRYERVAA